MDSHVALSQISKTRNLLTQHVGSETLLYNEQTHQAFCLNPIAAQVWRLLESAGSVSQVAAEATLELEMPVSEEAVLFTLAELRRDGLIEITEPAGTLPRMDRRDLLQKLGVGAAMMLPVVAAIVAPKAAQAYNGCVDCTVQGGDGDPSKKSPQQDQQQGSQQKNSGNSPNGYHPLFVP